MKLITLGPGLYVHANTSGINVAALYAGTKKTLTIPASVGKYVGAKFIPICYNGETLRIETGRAIQVPAVIGDIVKATYPTCTLV